MERQFLGFLFVFCLLLYPSLLNAENLPLLIFKAPESLQPITKRLSAMGWPYYSYAMQLAGLGHPGPAIHVYVVLESAQFGAQFPSWVSGFANGEASTIVLFAERVHSYPARAIEDLLVHEVSHILNYRATHGGGIPRWFDEGIATIAARTWDIEDQARLLWAIGDRNEFSLERMNAFFRGDVSSVRRGYVLSAGFVRDIIQEYGHNVPRQILSLVAQGVPFPTAFQQIVSLSPDQAVEVFVDRQSVWLSWVPLVTSNFMVWIGISMLAFVVFGMHVRRLKARRRQQEEEEQDDWGFDYGELEQPTGVEWDDRSRDS